MNYKGFVRSYWVIITILLASILLGVIAYKMTGFDFLQNQLTLLIKEICNIKVINATKDPTSLKYGLDIFCSLMILLRVISKVKAKFLPPKTSRKSTFFKLVIGAKDAWLTLVFRR